MSVKLIIGLFLLAIGGSSLASLPHAIAWARSGDLTYIADGDGLLYLAWSRDVVLGGEDRLTDAIHPSSGPMMHPWLLFIPLARLTRELGLGMSGLGVVWRVVSGALIALSLFVAIRPKSRRAGVAVGLAAFVLTDPGMMFGQLVRYGLEILVSLAKGSHSYLSGVPLIMPHLRVVTPGLALPALLFHFGAILRARQGAPWFWRVLAIATFGLLFSVYFYYWTMVALGLALAFICDREGRWLYLLVLFGGLILGAPGLWEQFQIRQSTSPDWLSRTNKFVAIGHFEDLLWPKGLILGWLAVTYWVFRKRTELIYLWCCTGAGLFCLNHQIVTGLQIENEHWSGAYGVAFSLLLIGLIAPAIDRAIESNRSRAWRWAFGLVLAVQVAIGFGLRSVEAIRSDETIAIHELYTRWRDDPSFREIPGVAVVAGDPQALGLAAAMSRIRPLSSRLVEFSARADDVELDERLLLNMYLLGVDRLEARRWVELPAGTLSWEAAATRSAERADRQQSRRLAMIEAIWTDPRPLIERFDVSWVVLPRETEDVHLAELAHREHSGPHYRSWRLLRATKRPRTVLRRDGKRGLELTRLTRLTRLTSDSDRAKRLGRNDPIIVSARSRWPPWECRSSGKTPGTIRMMKIVIAEDSAVSREFLRKSLEALNFEVTALADGIAAWEHLRTSDAQVVITDWMMPGLDGLDLCRKIRERGPSGPYIYVILLTARTGREDRLLALQSGADDFLSKPLDRAELSARLNVACRIINMEEQLRSRSVELERMHSELEQRNALLAELATCDSLTGLKNHRFFRESLEEQFSHARREGLPLSVVMIDIDQFKTYNDTYGHPAGDDALCTVSERLRSCVRNPDIVARYGGEEFAVLSPGTNQENSRLLGERLRVSIQHHAWPLRPITISLGISTMTARTPRAAALIEEADRSLYQSKAEGRNRVTHCCELPSDFADRRALIVENLETHPEAGEYTTFTR